MTHNMKTTMFELKDTHPCAWHVASSPRDLKPVQVRVYIVSQVSKDGLV